MLWVGAKKNFKKKVLIRIFGEIFWENYTFKNNHLFIHLTLNESVE